MTTGGVAVAAVRAEAACSALLVTANIWGLKMGRKAAAAILIRLLLCPGYFDLLAGLELTLLHTNDVHARIEETNTDSARCPPKGDCYAGVARRFTKINEIRSQEKNVLLLDAGDQFQGTMWFNYYKGAEAAHFLNRLGYNAMVRTSPL